MISLLGNRLSGDYTIDPWGLDPQLVELVSPVLSLRYSIETDLAAALPEAGPAVVVANRSLGLSEPVVLARALRLATGRHVRVTGIPDFGPVGSLLRRAGGVLARPDEVSGLLRAGEVVALFLDRTLRRGAGDFPLELLEPAHREGVPVFPAALVGREVGRHWRVLLGVPVEHPAGAGPLAELELAERARAGVVALLEEAGS